MFNFWYQNKVHYVNQWVLSTIPFMSSSKSNKWVTGLVYLYRSVEHLWCLFIKIFKLVGNKRLCCKHVVFCPLLHTGPRKLWICRQKQSRERFASVTMTNTSLLWRSGKPDFSIMLSVITVSVLTCVLTSMRKIQRNNSSHIQNIRKKWFSSEVKVLGNVIWGVVFAHTCNRCNGIWCIFILFPGIIPLDLSLSRAGMKIRLFLACRCRFQ